MVKSSLSTISHSSALDHVSYDIRGPLLRKAQNIEQQGHQVIKLNIGNPAPFGFDAPSEMLQDLIKNLPQAQGYCDAKGLFSARKAVVHYTQRLKIPHISIDDVYMGNGVSELIMMSMQALLNSGDEVLIPSPDYPLWSAVVALCGGVPVYYQCDESEGWTPDLDDIKAKITTRTKALLIINPNNPTGAVYTEECVRTIAQLGEKHGIVLLSDEIYDQIIYNKAPHIPLARHTQNTLCITYGGLSKNYRAAGFRSGWMILSGRVDIAKEFILGLDTLASMRLCANVLAQLTVQTALGGYQSIRDLVADGGRLKKQRDLVYQRLLKIPGISCVEPQGALYAFPKIDALMYPDLDDHRFAMELLVNHHVLIVPGRSFHLTTPNHFRMTLLPHQDIMDQALDRIESCLKQFRV